MESTELSLIPTHHQKHDLHQHSPFTPWPLLFIRRIGDTWTCDHSWTWHGAHIVFQNFIMRLYFISPLIRRLQATFGCRYRAMHLGYQTAYYARAGVYEVLTGQNYRPVAPPLGAPKFS